MAGDEDGVHIYYGTPLVSEEELNPRKRKAALDQGQARHVAPWNQEVTDSEGRRRFHGAFSGGFSAGYFNTVGSKEGWTPQTFTSSRKSRAEKKAQSAYEIMDEDEKAEIDSKNLEIRPDFDTFGSTAAELARRHASKEIGDRPSVIPGPLIDEIVVPADDSLGVKLLLKMGWRRGRQIGPKHIAAASGARREGRKAMLSFATGSNVSSGAQQESAEANEALEEKEEVNFKVPRTTPSYVINPKKDLHGLGFDPFKNAPEFRERKRFREEETIQASHGGWKGHSLALKKPSLFRPNAGKMGSGFGIGALEDLGEEDEDVYDQGMQFEVQEVEDDDKSAVDAKKTKKWLLEDPVHRGSVLPGFHLSKEPPKKKAWFPPLVVPNNFKPVHKFVNPLHSVHLQRPAPPEAQPPDNLESCKYIEGLAAFVAKSGPRFEDISREKQIGNPKFAFLFGGPGHDFYVRRLWEEEQKLLRDGKQQIQIGSQQIEKPGRKSKFSPQLNADERGKMLGEVPLPKEVIAYQRENVPVASMVGADDRARLQSALSSTFTSSGMAVETDGTLQGAFKNDPAKQARFEQFMKDKSIGGLRKPTIGGSGLSEIQRSQEISEFEAVARSQTEGTSSVKSMTQNTAGKPVPEMAVMMGSRFTTGGVENPALVGSSLSREVALREDIKQYPRREENPWRPSSMLCKRFDLLDPYAGKAAPLPKPRSRTESYILLTNPVESKPEFRPAPSRDMATQNSRLLESSSLEPNEKMALEPALLKEEKIESIPERPVDLYKAIFSDNSDDDVDETKDSESLQHVATLPGSLTKVNVNKSAEAANAALNRLVAGDFLESLGKELGLKLPEIPRLPVDIPVARDMEGRIRKSDPKGLDSNRGTEASTTMSIEHSRSFHIEKAAAVQFRSNSAASDPLPNRVQKQIQEGETQSEANGALFGVKTRYLDIQDNSRGWGDEKTDARRMGAQTSNVAAPSSLPRAVDTDSDPDTDVGKALAKKIRQEEKRLKHEKKEKKKHKRRKDRSHDNLKEKKREKSREKEGRHHRKHQRRRSPSSSSTSS